MGEFHDGIYKGLGWHFVFAELIQNTEHESEECLHSLVPQWQQLKYDLFPMHHLAAGWGCVTVWFCHVPTPWLPVYNNSHDINTYQSEMFKIIVKMCIQSIFNIIYAKPNIHKGISRNLLHVNTLGLACYELRVQP